MAPIGLEVEKPGARISFPELDQYRCLAPSRTLNRSEAKHPCFEAFVELELLPGQLPALLRYVKPMNDIIGHV
jgi:hypothetical protein